MNCLREEVMFMRKFKVMKWLLIAFISMPARAGIVNLSSFQLWSTTNGSDVIRVIPDNASVVAEGCNDPDSYMVDTALTDAAKSRIYSTLLAAKMSDKPVRLNIQGCESNRPAINNVILN